MIAFCVIEPSLQRVRGSLSCGADKSSYVIHGHRIGTSSLRKGAFLHAPTRAGTPVPHALQVGV
jgi:hypothetical protein